MERKYKIASAYSIIPMLVNFKQLDSDEIVSVSIAVNYTQDQVVFHGEKIVGIDYDDLEQEILSYIRPSTIETPKIPVDVLERISKVRSGEYQAAFNEQTENK